VGSFELPQPASTEDPDDIEEGVPPIAVDYEIPHESGEVQAGSLLVQSGQEFFIELHGAPRGEASLRFRVMATTNWLRSLKVPLAYDDVTNIGVIRPDSSAQERLILVLDAQRSPIRGAVPACGGLVFPATDEQGWGTVSLPAGCAEVRVGALGYETRSVSVETSGSGPIEVQLFSANSLSVTAISDQPDVGVPGLVLSMRVHVAAPLRREDARLGLSATRGPAPLEFSFGGESHALTYALDKNGQLKLYDLIATLPHYWTLTDGYGHSIANGIVSVSMGEQAELKIPVRIPGGTIQVCAIQEDGTPIHDFNLRLGNSPASRKPQRTKAGHLVFDDVYVHEALVEISAEGYASRVMNLRPQEEPHQVQLTPSRRRWLEISDAAGAPIDGSFQARTGPDEWRFLTREGPGMFFTDDLGEAIEVHIRRGGTGSDSVRRFTLNGERTRIIWN